MTTATAMAETSSSGHGAGESSSSTSAGSGIRVYHTYVPAPLPTAPSFNLHLTRLRDTLFIWVGDTRARAGPGGEEDEEAGGGGEKRLAADWSVSMPARGNLPVTATPVYRSGATDLSLAMSQRLAKKFPGNQIHLSLSLSSALVPSSQGQGASSSIDPFASKVLLIMEKKLGAWLQEVIQAETEGR